MQKVSCIEISKFRGVSHNLTLDTRTAKGECASILLIGDNGSGKSTIVDAFSFCLQGKISRSHALTSSFSPSVLSFYDESGCYVRATFDCGKNYERRLSIVDGEHKYHGGAIQEFDSTPLAIRRADILQFWDTPDGRKLVLFSEFYKPHRQNGSASDVNIPLTVTAAEEELAARKKVKKQIWENLANELGVSEVDTTNDIQLEEWITTHVYNGVISSQRYKLMQRGKPITLPSKTYKLLVRLRESAKKVADAKRKYKQVKKQERINLPTPYSRALQAGLEQISKFVTVAFAKISTSTSFVDTIDLHIAKTTDVSLTTSIVLKNGSITTPRKVFSEANLDLLSLLVYVGIAKHAALSGQARMLILDDVFQSIDGVSRIRALEYIVTEMRDWQFIITVHDRMWAEHVRAIFKRNSVTFLDREIRRWTFNSGLEISDATQVPYKHLSHVIEHGECYQICAESGMLLERICNVYSIVLQVAVIRRKDDKYTLGDLWPGVRKALQKTLLRTIADEVNQYLHLRNLVGAHYNEWATSLTREEAVAFGIAVVLLTQQLWCNLCHLWVDSVRDSSSKVVQLGCKCNAICIHFQ